MRYKMIYDNKKAAMFGLDARIALAIFGALSVITGVALYSAIQNAKATALLTEMQEVGKAWEQYYLDTGQNLPRYSEDNLIYQFSILKSGDLVENTTSTDNWRGPYISHPKSGDSLSFTKFLSSLYILTLTDEETWGGTNNWTSGKCTANKKCFIYIYMTGVPSGNLLSTIDRKVDNNDGADKGKFRWHFIDNTNLNEIVLQYAPIKNPND